MHPNRGVDAGMSGGNLDISAAVHQFGANSDDLSHARCGRSLDDGFHFALLGKSP